MSTPKIIAVIGATGAQGRSLVNAIRNDTSRRFIARAITRNPASEAARALGVEVVHADLDDAASLLRAFEGVHGVFGLAALQAQSPAPSRRLARVHAAAAAAAAAGVEHVVWSSLNAHDEATEVFAASGVPTTSLVTSFFWDDLLHLHMAPRRADDGCLVLTLPLGHKKLPALAAVDVGHCALGVFRDGAARMGRTIGLAGEHLSGHEMADALSCVLGEPVRYESGPVCGRVGFPAAGEWAHLFEGECCFTVEESRRLHAGLQTFRQWLGRHRAAIPVG